MEFKMWLFVIKKIAQTYDAATVVYASMPEATKESLLKEYEQGPWVVKPATS